MKTLLQHDYVAFWGLTGNYSVEAEIKTGLFTINDKDACSACKNNCKQDCDVNTDEQNLIVSSTSNVTIVDIEQFLKQFDGRRAGTKDKCDRMLYNNDTIVFVDMYCGQQKYIYPYSNSKGQQPGKLAKVRKQICATIDKLCEVPTIKSRIDLFNKKEGIFASRIKTAHNNKSQAARNMQSFINSIPTPSGYTIISQGFRFRTLQYPQEYKL